jgi:hypothetical protein
VTPAEVKEWLYEQSAIRPFPGQLPLHERLLRELELLGFDRIRLEKVEPHPVWNFRGTLGQCCCSRPAEINRRLRRMIKEFYLDLKMTECATDISGGRIHAIFCIQ